LVTDDTPPAFQSAWELSCSECGYADRAGEDMPTVPYEQKPELADRVWTTWAGTTSAAFADWPLSVERRTTFLAQLRAFSESFGEILHAELLVLADKIKATQFGDDYYGVSAVLLAHADAVARGGEPARLADACADQLAQAHSPDGMFQLFGEQTPWRHWKELFQSRVTALADALEHEDAVQASVAAGQLKVEADYYGFLLPLRLTLNLSDGDTVSVPELNTHVRHLAEYLEGQISKVQKKGRPSAAQLEDMLRRYVQGLSEQTNGS
jgi:hypothetical protein